MLLAWQIWCSRSNAFIISRQYNCNGKAGPCGISDRVSSVQRHQAVLRLDLASAPHRCVGAGYLVGSLRTPRSVLFSYLRCEATLRRVHPHAACRVAEDVVALGAVSRQLNEIQGEYYDKLARVRLSRTPPHSAVQRCAVQCSQSSYLPSSNASVDGGWHSSEKMPRRLPNTFLLSSLFAVFKMCISFCSSLDILVSSKIPTHRRPCS